RAGLGRFRRPVGPGDAGGCGAGSALRVLGRLAGLLQAVLAALLLARVPTQVALLLEDRTKLGVDLDQRSSDPEPERPRLSGDAAADAGQDIEVLVAPGAAKRRRHDHPVSARGEVLLQAAAVQHEVAAARDEANPGHGLLSPSG